MKKEQIKAILKASINSAVGVDDEFVGPYESDSTETDVKVSSELYQAFQRDLNCTMSLYRYSDYERFSKVSYLLNHKDLLLLDWQLKGKDIDALKDVVMIIDKAVSQDSPIRFIVVYTASEDLYYLSKDLYSAFTVRHKDGVDIDSIKDAIDEILISNQEELDIDSLEKVVRENLSKCLLKKHRIEAIKTINQTICKLLSRPDSKVALKAFSDQLDEVLVKLELSLCSESAKSNDYPDRNVQVLEEDVLLIENTAVFFVTKQGVGKHGFGPDQLVDHLCSRITYLNNWRSLLLSLKFQDTISREMSIVGKGLGGFNDSVLMQYIKADDADSTVESITNCFVVQVGDVLNKFDKEFLTDLWNRGEESVSCSLRELGQLVSFLSFLPCKKDNHRINTGDVFMLKEQHLFQSHEEEEFLMCITQSCDCLHPKKVLNNFSFAVGEKVSVKSALNSIQNETFSIVDDDVCIKWDNRFLTIHIPENKLSFTNSLNCLIVGMNQNGEMEPKTVELIYLGHQKEIYAQRVINAVFSHSMRIGIGLPQWKDPR